ncbi:hypothetical protein GQ55_5G406900 [Panicum hallii var. hallii]|uniref:NAD-dependent epimerase/dehydratase domain-containing protein n=1 Tax=Panicum hallii var. hallii TaxID=1504633 RepID=A0A2T7DNK5_9POAL|nr:hypothetical protein GQ55_5G406900 [Panicum hallii var. hallii]
MNGSNRWGMVWPAGERLVCVTGAGGFIGSALVKELLQRGYAVRGTTRNPEDRKNAHLQSLDGAEERLSLCRADLLDYKSLCAAFTSCDGVFHVASPVLDNDPELMAVATEGTKNVINAAADTGVQRVVSPDHVVDESCWSDLEYCLQTKNFYCNAKTVAAKTTMEEVSKRAIQLLVVLPSWTIGEMLQPTLNLGIELLIVSYMKGTKKAYPNTVSGYVDVVRAHFSKERELVLQYPITTKSKDDTAPMIKPYKFSTQRLQALRMKFTPLKESLHKTVVCLQVQAHIPMLSHKSAL